MLNMEIVLLAKVTDIALKCSFLSGSLTLSMC